MLSTMLRERKRNVMKSEKRRNASHYSIPIEHKSCIFIVICHNSSQWISDQKATKPTLKAALEQLLTKTGYVGTVVLSAPNPEKGGSIKTTW